MPGNTLKPAAIANAIWSAQYPQLYAKFTTAELLDNFAEFDPLVRRYAADEFAKRPDAREQVGKLIEMSGHADAKVRETACQVLGALKPERALPVLVARLKDKDAWVRVRAAKALRSYGAAAEPQPAQMMKAFIANGSTDANSIDWSNPLRIDNATLAGELFGTLGKQTYGQAEELLYPAVRVGLAQPCGLGGSCLGDFNNGEVRGFLSNLTWDDVQALAPGLVRCAAELPSSDPGGK
ncbi:MAG: HEAT repeat domain-containing protein [Verrucomicrobia bacterium]|nr:HEAT repeat domain-containing protein [Verrucomicrobiota bacterium]